MTHNEQLTAERLHARLSHPVVDADGHWLEFGPMMREQMRRIGGDLAAQGCSVFAQLSEDVASLPMTERKRRRIPQGGWWLVPTKNKLHAAASSVVQQPQVKALLAKFRYEVASNLTPEAAVKRLADEAKFVADVASKIGMKPE